MGADHEPFTSLGPVEWQQIPQDSLPDFFTDIFSETQTIVESIPSPAAKQAETNTNTGRARSKTESAVSAGDVVRAHLQRQKAASMSQSQDLRKEWKEAKVNAKDNPLGINVYKLSSKDGRGAWFARRSVHEGLSFDNWKKGLEIEFGETMKVQGAPGSGNIRGIGADKHVEDSIVDDNNHLQGKLSVLNSHCEVTHCNDDMMLTNYANISLPTLGPVSWPNSASRFCHSTSYFRVFGETGRRLQASETVHDCLKAMRAPQMPSTSGYNPWLLRICRGHP